MDDRFEGPEALDAVPLHREGRRGILFIAYLDNYEMDLVR